jgi:nitrate/TMAO reductase-like tetraheme cytochrome c subunit
MAVTILAVFAAVTILLLLVLASLLKSLSPGFGRVLALVLMVALPGAWMLGMFAYADSEMKKVSFCTSCHQEMGAYGESLKNDEYGALAATHYLHNRVDQKKACYVCHTEPGLRGYVDAKLRGLHDVRVHYFGEAPDELELVKPYSNTVCLSCHGEAQNFLEGMGHQYPETLIDDLKAGEVSCLDCHGPAHSLEAE